MLAEFAPLQVRRTEFIPFIFFFWALRVIGPGVAVGVGVGVALRRCLDRNRHWRACLEEPDRRIGALWRLIGVKPEVVECAPANRISVLILRKRFAVPGYGIGRLSNSPRRAAVTLVVECTVICPAGFLRRRMKVDVADVNSGSQRHTERIEFRGRDSRYRVRIRSARRRPTG